MVSPPHMPAVQLASQSPVTETTLPQFPPSQDDILEMIVVEPPPNGAEGTRRERRQQLRLAAERPIDDNGTEGRVGGPVIGIQTREFLYSTAFNYNTIKNRPMAHLCCLVLVL